MGRRPDTIPREEGDSEAWKLAARIGEIAALVHESGEARDVIRALVDRILVETDACYAGIALVDEGGEHVVHAFGVRAAGPPIPEGHRQRVGEGAVGEAVTRRQVVHLPDVTTAANYVPLVPETRSEVVVPLILQDRVVGALDIESRRPGNFGPEVLTLLKGVAPVVAQAVSNAQLVERARRHVIQLELLNRVSRILTSTVALEPLLQGTADCIREMVGFEVVAIGLVEPSESDEVVVLRALSASLPLMLRVGHSQALGEGVVGEVVATGRSASIPDVRKHANHVPLSAAIRSEMAVPLRVRGEVIGFLDAESCRLHAFGDDDLRLLETLADHISSAVDNARTLERLENLRAELAAMVVHDLRNPLTVLSSWLHVIEATMLGHEQVEPIMLDGARGACREIEVLANRLLDLHRLEDARVPLSLAPTELDGLVGGAIERLGVVARARGVGLSFVADDDSVTMPVDEQLMTRVVENLLTNALRATPSGGLVTARLCCAVEDGLRAELTIEDTGHGIAEDLLETIFRKFVTTGEARHGRAGLGLPFCRRVVEEHGGRVWAENRADGPGARFTVALPMG